MRAGDSIEEKLMWIHLLRSICASPMDPTASTRLLRQTRDGRMGLGVTSREMSVKLVFL